jgi:hypothetical protein
MKWNFSDRSKTTSFLQRVQKIVPNGKRMFMVEAYRQLTISTPVDTGRARFGYNCSISEKDQTVPTPGKYSLDATRATKIFTVSVPMEKAFYITNDVPYIGRLNDGYSQQAPARFWELCVYNAMGKLKKKYGKR